MRKLGLSHHPADFPAGQRKQFARRSDLDRSFGHSRQCCERSKRPAIQNDMFPNLVADHEKVMIASDCRDHFELIPREQTTGRILRVVEHNCPCRRSNCTLEVFAIDAPFRGTQRNFDRRPTRSSDHWRITIIGRGQDDDFIAFIDRGQDRSAQGFGGPARHAHMVRSEQLAEVPVVMVCNRSSEHHRPTRRRILIGAFEKRFRSDIEDLIGPSEIRKTLSKIDGVVLGSEPGHALEHARPHIFVNRIHGSVE